MVLFEVNFLALENTARQTMTRLRSNFRRALNLQSDSEKTVSNAQCSGSSFNQPQSPLSPSPVPAPPSCSPGIFPPEVEEFFSGSGTSQWASDNDETGVQEMKLKKGAKVSSTTAGAPKPSKYQIMQTRKSRRTDLNLASINRSLAFTAKN